MRPEGGRLPDAAQRAERALDATRYRQLPDADWEAQRDLADGGQDAHPAPCVPQPFPMIVPGNTTSVGAFVVRQESVLVVRLTYGPTEGRYSLPGGLLDVGEEIDSAAVRETLEETGVETTCAGVIGLRVRSEGGRSQTDLMWLLEYVAGEPRSDGAENDDARFMPFDDVLARDDVEEIVQVLVRRAREGAFHVHRLYGQNLDGVDDGAPPRPEEWKLFL
jgi:8-oxo-dGTP diphosphatase